MNSEYVRRNISINGKRTSISLERTIWAGLEEICSREGVGLNELCSSIDQARHTASRTSTVRSFAVNYFRVQLDRAENGEMLQSGQLSDRVDAIIVASSKSR